MVYRAFFLVACVIACVTSCPSNWLGAQTQQFPNHPTASTAATANAPSHETSEQAVLEFVQQHQPELARLLSFLKMNRPSDYQQALRENRKVRDRLTTLRDRDPELFEVELALWKNAAQLRLLAAAASAKGKSLSATDREQLKQLITEENELTIQRLNLDKTRAESRLNQLTQQLSRRQEQAETVISKGLKSWENRIERSGKSPKK